MASDAIRILITGAAGQIAYSLIPIVAKGDVFGYNQPLILHLLDIPMMENVLKGVVMEIEDCVFPLVQKVIATTNEAEAFKDVDAAFLVGARPRGPGMERKDLLAANVQIFASQGKSLAAYSKENVKVLVVGNPANTNALICSKFAEPKIPAKNITAMTRLDQNRTIAQLSLKYNIPAKDIENVCIWGNHSSTQYPDVSRASTANGKSGFAENSQDLIKTVQQRGAAVIAARKLSSAMSAAKAAADHMKDWWNGTDKVVSMGVISNGNSYGIPDGLIFSFPATVCSKSKNWKIVEGLTLDKFSKEMIEITTKELKEEKEEALMATGSNL